MSINIDNLKVKAIQAIDSHRDELVQLSTTIHSNPETAFKEFMASKLLTQALENAGMKVDRGVGGLDTAFLAEANGSSTKPTVALLAEYDALPEIGHACGHNIMGSSCVGGAIGVMAVMMNLPGRFLVIGTPAEEGGAGKIILLKRGVFKGVDAAMLVHPAAKTLVDRGSLASMRLVIEFTGKASHAAAAPQDGISALEAVIQTFNNINSLRLHLRPDARVHGIIKNGGTAVNIIPEYASAHFSIRAKTKTYCDEVLERVIRCARAAEESTGATLKTTIEPGYANMVPNLTLASQFAENYRTIGVSVLKVDPDERMGSTDMGNISQALPAIHAYIAIAPEGTAGHTVEMRAAANSPAGNDGLIFAAKAMAMTTIDLLGNPELMQKVKIEFDQVFSK